MDIVGKAKAVERKLARTLDAAVGELLGSSAPAPLEIIEAMLDRAEQEVQHAGRGRRVFPYTIVRLHVRVAPRDRQARARFAVFAEGPPTLTERLRARLEAAGCQPSALRVEMSYAGKRGAAWTNPEYHVEFDRAETSLQAVPAPASAGMPALKLTIVKGKASHRVYTFTGGRVDVGRRSEVLDSKHRLVRTNHVVFDEEGADVNSSVSRQHAHVTYDAQRREYRIHDDRSAHGTGIVRAGRTIPVHAGSRGVRLESGDEVLLGQARLRVTIGE